MPCFIFETRFLVLIVTVHIAQRCSFSLYSYYLARSNCSIHVVIHFKSDGTCVKSKHASLVYNITARISEIMNSNKIFVSTYLFMSQIGGYSFLRKEVIFNPSLPEKKCLFNTQKNPHARNFRINYFLGMCVTTSTIQKLSLFILFQSIVSPEH